MSDGELAYDRWLRGECFCCGQPVGLHGQPTPVNESVMMCARCVKYGHARKDRPMLKRLLAGMAEAAIRAHAHVPLSERE